ncbi:MAG: stage V sporulation protein AC [Ruminococcus sp.]|nr:stage V sporulation protein AC [Ruminococcus sp.]MCM1393147.1 stage V sporulation protein AC [Ruminococcus sp.]
MSISKEEYGKMAKKASPSSPILLDCLMAFLVGGFICCFAQGLTEWFKRTGMNEEEYKALVLVIIIAITAILTGFGVFDKIAKHAGAGTMVPITGFANSIVSPAMEFKTEGYILGTAANMFSIAGPVIVFGCGSAVIYGLIAYIFKLY